MTPHGAMAAELDKARIKEGTSNAGRHLSFPMICKSCLFIPLRGAVFSYVLRRGIN